MKAPSLLISVLDNEWSASSPDRITLREETTDTHSTRAWEGPVVVLDAVEEISMLL
jgi:hypothetical protein